MVVIKNIIGYIMKLNEALSILKNNNYIVEATSQQYCMDCGAKVDPHDNYCETCGAELDEDDDVGSKEEAEKELGKLNVVVSKFCTNCGHKLDYKDSKSGKCTKCGDNLMEQDPDNRTFLDALKIFTTMKMSKSDFIDIKYGIKDGYYRFIIDCTPIEKACTELYNKKSDDELMKIQIDACQKLQNSFKKMLEKLKKSDKIRYKNNKFYYECKKENFDLHEFNFITKILLEYLLNDSMLYSLLGICKENKK